MLSVAKKPYLTAAPSSEAELLSFQSHLHGDQQKFAPTSSFLFSLIAFEKRPPRGAVTLISSQPDPLKAARAELTETRIFAKLKAAKRRMSEEEGDSNGMEIDHYDSCEDLAKEEEERGGGEHQSEQVWKTRDIKKLIAEDSVDVELKEMLGGPVALTRNFYQVCF